MNLKHLTALMPAFIDELEKDAGIKDDLKLGTTKVLSALKAAPKKAETVAMKARSAPVVGKAITMATDPLNAPDIGHALGNFAKMIGH